MRYGLLGEKLGHSFSKEIHQKIANYKYELFEVAKDQFHNFMTNLDFKAINVTIPYKEKVISYLDFLDEKAKEINAVNTIVNKDGKLYGYNTDYFGLKALINYHKINIKDKKVLIFGSGGTSKTASIVARDLEAKEIIKVSRNKCEGYITYSDLDKVLDVDVIINTTPVGMYPNCDNAICELDSFNNLQAVIDCIYNPINTKLMQNARKLGIKAVNGLYMLVAQAVYASHIFLDRGTVVDNNIIDNIYKELLLSKENIVLIGMPSCGKSTIGLKLSKLLNKEFVDSDNEIEKRIGMRISSYLTKDNENEFRDIESKVISDLSIKNNLVIATGGGVIKRFENIQKLRYNSQIIFIDRSLNLLKATKNRPLSNNFQDLLRLYQERYPKYCEYADYRIKNDGVFEKTADKIYKLLKENN